MTNKVELNTLSQVNNNERAFLTALNENLKRIQAAINDTLSRTGVVPNQMEELLDMNGKRIANVGDAVEDHDVVTKAFINGLISQVNEAIAQLDSLVEAAKTAIETYASEYIYPVCTAAVDACQEAQRKAEQARDAILLDPGYLSVVANLNKLTALADDLANIDTLVADLTNVDTVAGIASDVTAVAGISSAVSALAGITSEIQAVQAKLTEITAVAGDLTNVDTVAGSIANINAVAGALSDISAVEAALTDIASVAGALTDIAAIAADLNTLLAVGADLTNLDSIAADLTNLDSIASNLTEILNAATYASQAATSASNASIWAEGTDQQVSALGGTHSAKVWAEIVQQIVANTRIFGGSFDPTTATATLTNAAKVKLGTTSDTIVLTNDTTAVTGYGANEGIEYMVSADGTFAGLTLHTDDLLWSTGSAWKKIDNAGTSYTAGTGIDITGNTISVIAPTLVNTATGTGSLTVGGTATSATNAVNVGANSSVAQDGVALGSNAAALGTGSIQIGQGTNITDNTLSVGLSNEVNVQLLNSSGKVPTGRYIVMTGADGDYAGATGSVPAPAATDNTKFLRGDGTWAVVAQEPTYDSSTGTVQL